MSQNNQLPSLNQWDQARLEESIKNIGIRLPIVFDQYGRIIDGYHRKEIADQLGIDYPKQVIHVADDEEFNKLAIDLNLARRHLSYEQIKSWYDDRKKIALEARKKGATQQEAAEAAGVSRQAVDQWEDELQVMQANSNTCSPPDNETDGGRMSSEHEEKSAKTSIPPDNRTKIDKSLYEEIWQRRQAGETTIALAAAYGVTHQQISSICAQVTKKKNRESESQKARECAQTIEIPDSIQIYCGDMQNPDIQNLIESNSIDLIFTDPPYPKEFLPLWDELAKLAVRVLKPSGLLVTYSGQMYLDIVMAKLSQELKYYWTIASIEGGETGLVHGRNIISEWKPILIFQKEPLRIIKTISDTVKSPAREKDLHDWQQSEIVAETLIQRLTEPGEIILDPFAGSGTTIVAALKNKRKAIAIEIEQKSVEIIKRRIEHAER